MTHLRASGNITSVHIFSALLMVLAGVMGVSRGQEVWSAWPGLLGGGAVLAVICRGRKEVFLLLGIVSFSSMVQTVVGDPPGAEVLFVALAGGGFLGLGLAVSLRCLVTRCEESGKRLVCLSAAAMGGLQIVMLVNGGLWVDMGSGALQVSEGLKIAMPLFVTGVLTWKIPVRTRYLLLMAATAFNLLCLALLSELGTAVVLAVSVWLVLFWAFAWEYSVITAAVGTALCLVVCRAAFLMQEQSALAKKIVQRLTLFLNPEQADPLKEGFQQASAGKALLFGGSLGNLHPERIPVASSDYILPACSATFGCLLTVVLVVILCGFYALFFRAAEEAPFEQVEIFGLVGWCEMVCASLLTAGGSVGLVPLAGIGIPIFSGGGSSLLVSTCLLSCCLVCANFPRAILYTGRRHRT